MRLDKLVVQQIVNAPATLEPGILYISKQYETALHLCPCGCGGKVVTPQHPTKGWILTGTDDCVTLRPSLLNTWCNSHYYITENRIDWL